MTRSSAWLLFSALLAPCFTAAQSPPAEVLVLGTYHFANPGLDVVQTEVADVLAPERQDEIARVVDGLARFRPTIVAVEATPSEAAALDSVYAAWRARRHALTRNEVQQLGFRLAERFDLAGVRPIDHDGDFPFEPFMAYAAQHDPEATAFFQRVMGEVQAELNRQQRELTIPAILRLHNDPARIAEGHGIYLRMNEVGAGDGYVGADVLAAWYERNIRIVANVQRLAAPGERVLVIIGSGHVAILRELIRHDPELRLVEANDFLPEQ